MSAQPITVLGNDAIQACYAPANQGLGSNAIPTCNAFNAPYKRACRSSKGQEARG